MTAPGSLDPALVNTTPAGVIAKQVCDTLVSFDQQTGELMPGIAESWAISPDARKVTFQIRPGVKFHNGRDVVAQDFVYSMSRLAHPGTGSPHHFLMDRVLGYAAIRSGEAAELAGVKAPAARTLEVELTEAYADFAAVMTTVQAGATVPKEEVDQSAEAFAALPVCTGPFRPEVAATPEGLRLVRHEAYHGTQEAYQDGGKGLASSFEFTFAPTEAAAYKLLDDGEVDVSPVDPSDLAEAVSVRDRVSSGPNGHVTYIGLPVTRAPFDNVDLRRALALSVDRSAIISGLLGNSRQMPEGFLPSNAGPGAAGGRCPAVIGPEPDLDGAKDAAGESGLALPDSMNVYLNDDGGHEQWVEPVTEQWRQALGIGGILKPSAWQPYIDLLADPGADGPFRLAWAVRFPSPEALYAPLFSSSSLDNFSRYSSAGFDAAMTKARSTVDNAERIEAYAEAGAILCRDVPIIPMWFGMNHVAFADGIAAAGPSRLDIFGDPILRDLRPE